MKEVVDQRLRRDAVGQVQVGQDPQQGVGQTVLVLAVARVLAAQACAVAHIAQYVREVGVQEYVIAHVDVARGVHQAVAEVPHHLATSAAAPRGATKPGPPRQRATSGQARGNKAELLQSGEPKGGRPCAPARQASRQSAAWLGAP